MLQIQVLSVPKLMDDTEEVELSVAALMFHCAASSCFHSTVSSDSGAHEERAKRRTFDGDTIGKCFHA